MSLGGHFQEYCGDEWLSLDGTLDMQGVSRVCCVGSSAPAPTPAQGPSGIDGDWLQAHNSRRSQYYAQRGM